MTSLLGRHAIVVGAEIGGLTAAKALSSYFGTVTVLERDALPPAPIVRTGTPQARQIHVLLRGGLDAELWRQTARERPNGPFGGSGQSGALREKPAVIRLF